MHNRVVVTGMGLVSPIGHTIQQAWEKVLFGTPCISALNDLPDYASLPSKVVAKIAVGSEKGCLNISEHIPDSKLRTLSRSTIYALIAAKKALENANWMPEKDESKEETGVAIGMGMVDFVDVCQTQNNLEKGYKHVSPYFIPRILPNMAAGHVSMEYGFQGPNHTVSTACATGAHAIGDSFNMIRNGLAKVMVCGGTEAPINPLSVAGFCRLRALSTSFNDDPLRASRPFDTKRDGFVIGEGSAIIILEEMNHAITRKANIYAEILGYGLSGDAANLTAPHESGRGAILAMSRAIKDANISTSEVSYINAHATSTKIGDAVELNAIRTLFGTNSQNIIVSSTKGVHGHLLGAAGSLESLFTILSCYHSVLPPTANLEQRCNEASYVNCISDKTNWNVIKRIALKNSFGFGGTNACLCLSQFIP